MKVLFVDVVHQILDQRLEEMGMEVIHDHISSREEILLKIHEYRGLVIRSRFPLDEEFLKKASHLKFIARSGSGLENINLEAAERFGIKVINSPEGNKTAVAEHCIGMLLSLFNHLKRGDIEVRSGQWNREKNRGLEISGKTIGIIGYGQMGTAFAKRLSGFDCQVIAYDKYRNNYSDEWADEASLERLKSEAEIISLHLPQSTETHHYINEQFIHSCMNPFYLVNTGRGKHVELKALENGLKSEKILGACLDVLEIEKSSFENINLESLPKAWSYLKNHDRVLFSPHVAGWTQESYVKLSSILADKIEFFLNN